MTNTISLEPAATHCKLNEELKKLPGNDWCHQIEIAETGDFLPAENLKHRVSVLKGVFASLFKDQSVLVLNEYSGIYPSLIKRSGASAVTANNMNRQNCELMRDLSSFKGDSFEILDQALVLFDNGKIFVDLDLEEKYNYLFAQNQIWNLYNAAGRNFVNVIDACSHYVTDGLVFDWTDAKWANPPADFNRENFHAALRERFEFVIGGSEWLTIAVGKLPPELSQLDETINQKISYRQVVNRLREIVSSVVPEEAKVLVVSKGDADLLRLDVRNCQHFPQAENGEYLGYYPTDSFDAAERLENLHREGAEFLVFPQTAFWWQEHYPEFWQELENNYRVVAREEDTCIIFALRN